MPRGASLSNRIFCIFCGLAACWCIPGNIFQTRLWHFSTLRKLHFHLLSNLMGCDRGDSFPLDFKPNEISFGSKSKGKLSSRSYPIKFESKWKCRFLSVMWFTLHLLFVPRAVIVGRIFRFFCYLFKFCFILEKGENFNDNFITFFLTRKKMHFPVFQAGKTTTIRGPVASERLASLGIIAGWIKSSPETPWTSP